MAQIHMIEINFKLTSLFAILNLVLFISFQSCEDKSGSDDMEGYPKTLRPITTTGDNVLACKVNGKLWESYVPINTSGLHAFRMAYDSVTGHFGINSWWIVDANPDIYQSVGFETYITKNVVGDYKVSYDKISHNYINFDSIYRPYLVDTNQINLIKIIYHNKLNRIISGTFEFYVISKELSDTIHVSEGRFDGTY